VVLLFPDRRSAGDEGVADDVAEDESSPKSTKTSTATDAKSRTRVAAPSKTVLVAPSGFAMTSDANRCAPPPGALVTGEGEREANNGSDRKGP